MSRRSDPSRPHGLPAARRLLAAAVFTMTTAIAVAQPASAEIQPKAAASKSKPTAVESMARIADDTPRSVLRCWQEGRLIFEAAGMSIGAAGGNGGASGGDASTLLRASDGRTVQLLDLRQGLCVLERSRG